MNKLLTKFILILLLSFIVLSAGCLLWDDIETMRRKAWSVGIAGYPYVGATITADTSRFMGTGYYVYQWRKDGNNIYSPDYNSYQYTVDFDDIGSAFTLTVTCSDSGYSVTSGQTALVPVPTVSIKGDAVVDEILEAVTTNLGGTIYYQWMRSGEIISEATSKYYTVLMEDVGETISVMVTVNVPSSLYELAGGLISAPTGKVPVPLSGTVKITETNTPPQAGDTLTITLDFNGTGTKYYQWRRNEEVISGANSDTYTLQFADGGHYITVSVTTSENSGSITSPHVPIPNPYIIIEGAVVVGQTLTATVYYVSGEISYQWLRNNNKINDATESSYTLQPVDAGTYISVTITSTKAGSLPSSQTEDVKVPVDFTISFAAFADLAPVIQGPVIHIIGSGNTSATITVGNPSQYDAGSIVWYYDGEQIYAGQTLTISSDTYNRIGTHYITVGVVKDGRYYSKAISFEVKL